MSNFVPGNYDLRTTLIFCYHLKKTTAESYRMLIEAYGEHALDKSQCFEWFKKFKSGDFDVRNKECGKLSKKFEDSELQALLDEDDAQTQQQLADQLNMTWEAVFIRMKSMGKIQKMGKWVPHELNERQQENRKTTCEMLLARYKKVISHHLSIELWLAMKSGYILRILSVKDHG